MKFTIQLSSGESVIISKINTVKYPTIFAIQVIYTLKISTAFETDIKVSIAVIMDVCK
jgi:hypothetical protein